MGSRGPQQKPVELKLLEGNRGNRPLDVTALFRPEVGVPDAPRWLMPAAKKAWRRLSAELVRYNLLSRVDREAFAMLCQTIGRLELIEASLMAKQSQLAAQEKDPVDALTDVTPNGLRIQSVTYQLLNREQSKLHGLLKSFGLRPDARTAVTAGIRAQLQLFEGGAPAAGAPGSAGPQAPEFGEPAGFSDFN
jgi:P27 family predicted phage terminase small subunit